MGFARPSGFAGFVAIWLGQVLSALGTRMTNFAVGIFVWQQTGSATAMALLLLFSYLPTVLFSPIAGALVDRLPRRLTIVLSDVGSAAGTAVLLVIIALMSTTPLWLLYGCNALTGAFLAFQYPAYAAAITVMTAKQHYPRANALLSMARSVPGIFAPALAAAILLAVDIRTILLLDALTYVVAIGTVFLVRLPGDPVGDPDAPRPSVWRDSLFGFRYLWRVPALLKMEAVLFTTSMLAAIGWTLLIPLVLARTGDEGQAGLVQSIGAIGGVAGGLLMSAIPATRRKMPRIFIGMVAFGVVGRVLYGLGDTVWVWSLSLFAAWLCLPVITGYAQAVWQEKIQPALQGRVFAAQQLIDELSVPIGLAVSGLLADRLLEPQMRADGALAPVFGPIVGTGPGAGMALAFVFSGLLIALIAVIAYAVPSVRQVETKLPDHDTDATTTADSEHLPARSGV